MKKILLLLLMIGIFSIMISSSVSAVNCWEYDHTNQTECEAAGNGNDCQWDSGGQYCMEKGCWNYMNQTSCNAANTSGCFWQTDSGMGWNIGWCEDKVACWNYLTNESCIAVNGCLWRTPSCNGPKECADFSSESACTASGYGCWWDNGNYCYKPSAWDYKTQSECTNAGFSWQANAYCTEVGGGCWNYPNQTSCEAAGCGWDTWGGWCYKKSCGDYSDNESCLNATGGKCGWTDYGGGSGYCYEKNCWNYWNETACTNNPDNISTGCSWTVQGQCQNPSCYNYNESACVNLTGCVWANGKCSWEGCWNYGNSTSCAEANASGCYWKNSTCEGDVGCSIYGDYESCHNAPESCWWSWGDYCEQYYCWSDKFNTNITTCENDTDAYGLDCVWDSYWGNCNEKSCSDYNETECNASSECYWEASWCYDKSCWGISDSANCTARGCEWGNNSYCSEPAVASCYNLNEGNCTNNETFNTSCIWDSWSNSCRDRGCWDLTDNDTCLTLGANLSVPCEWTVESSGWCQESGAQCWEIYDNDTCLSNNCTWDATWNTCNQPGCWNYWTNETCNADANCDWTTESGNRGWCEQRSCLNWDGINGGNEAACLGNSTIYNLSCTWVNASPGEGICSPNITDTDGWMRNCWQYEPRNNGNETACLEAGCNWTNVTGYCFEQYSSLSNFTTEGDCLKSGWGVWNGTECTEPEGGISFIEFNPGCWIFDGLAAQCNSVQGCNYTNSSSGGICNNVGTDSIECANITNQTLCENIPILSTCCTWQAGNCTTTFDTKCWDQMAEPPKGATYCMDYNAIDSPTLCNQIAGDPWYMPCKWDNVSGQCGFKDGMASDVKDVKTKKNCEFLGGTWKTETVCDASTNNPTVNSWCEMGTGASTYGCDVSCWSCNTSTTCSASKKGYCLWIVDANADQGGFCDIPEFLETNGDCDVSCGSCEYYNGGDYTPQKACQSSKAQCKWDNATSSCVPKKSSSCSDDCFSCFDKNTCTVKGGGSQGTCKWDEVAQMCEPAKFVGEICFDGIDNDNNGKTDCDDSACIYDSFCGGGEIAQCWMYKDNNTCLGNGNCTWYQDPWTQTYICGAKGENCWVYDNNETGCNGDSACQWFTDGFCEINKTKADTCFAYSGQTACEENTACVWNPDEFSPQGGWCEFGPSECEWNQTLQQSKTKCESNNFCIWNIDAWSKEGRCSSKCFAWNSVTNTPVYNTSDSCNNAISGGLCEWSTGWCEPNSTVTGVVKGKDCQQYNTNRTACETQPSCAWFEEMMGGGPGGGGFMGSQCDVKYTIDCNDLNQTTCNRALQNGSFTGSGYGNACRWVTEGTWSWCEQIGRHCGPMYSPFNITTGDPTTNESGCIADDYCILMNDSYTNNTICSAPCMNPSLNITSCQSQVNGSLCVWTGSGGGQGDCEWDWCENNCMNNNNCTPVMTENCTAGCDIKCSGCYGMTSLGFDMQAFDDGGMSMGGWCDLKSVKDIFGTMESGKPHEVAFDDCGESGIDGWKDACFIGVKEMRDDYAFGIGLSSMTYSAACNGETLWDGSIGSGRQTIKGYIYLDTDGNETDNCISDNGAQTGFEFKLIETWKWSNNGLVQTLSAKRCLNGNWTAAKIVLNTYKKKMCSEMQGMIITVKKIDLQNFNTLFDLTYPMRMYAVTAGENETASTPADSVGPGYYSVGKADFKVEDCYAIGNVDADGDGFYAYEDPDCKFMYMSESKGFKEIEDCTTPQDDDMDGFVNCADSECKDEAICGGTLVFNSSDHNSPTIKKTTVNRLRTSADIVYITNERANGTLIFYYNLTGCVGVNKTIRDIGLLNENNTNIKKYVFVHKGKINNLSTNVDGLNNSLTPNTTYYYKIRVCDISNNCAQTGCLNFTTRNSTVTSTMKFTDPDAGEGWLIDKGTGNFTIMGGECASKSNSTLGDEVDPEAIDKISIKSERNETGGNVSLEIGGIDTSNDVVSAPDFDVGTAIGNNSGAEENYVWMNESGWSGDNGIYTQGAPDNITMQFPGNDSELWDCKNIVNGVLVNCTNMTGYANRTYNKSGNYTEWTIYNPPSDMFSYIIDETPTANGGEGSTGGSSGSSAGGGGAAPASTENVNETTTNATTGGIVTGKASDNTTGTPRGAFFGGESTTAVMLVVFVIIILAIFAAIVIFKKGKKKR